MDETTNDTLARRYLFVECDGCGNTAYADPPMGMRLPLTEEDHQMTIDETMYVMVDNGLCLDLSGHYGGFTDEAHGGAQGRVILCHNCSVKIARLLPGVFRRGDGYHSMTDMQRYIHNGGSCCEFAWTTEGATEGEYLVGDGCGGWTTRSEYAKLGKI
jgi:hypothetical protein